MPYEEVAEIVKGWPRLNGYGPYIAEKYEIPIATAHRWVSQARLRGYLPRGGEHECRVCGGTGVVGWGPKSRQTTR